jgi:hypothetical protein
VASPVLPAALVEEILQRFEPVLPEGVFLELRGGSLTAHGPSGTWPAGSIGQVGFLPWVPMAQSRKLELAVKDLAEEVTKSIGYVNMRPGQPDEPFRWPADGAVVNVAVNHGAIEISFLAGEPPVTLLTLQPLRWAGPFSEAALAREDRNKGPRRYFGPVPSGHEERVAETDRLAAERSAALHDLNAALKEKSQGLTPDEIRTLLRDEYQQRGLEPPSPDGAREDFHVGIVAASNSTHPSIAAIPVLTKGLKDIVRWGRATLNDLHEDDDPEDEPDE